MSEEIPSERCDKGPAVVTIGRPKVPPVTVRPPVGAVRVGSPVRAGSPLVVRQPSGARAPTLAVARPLHAVTARVAPPAGSVGPARAVAVTPRAPGPPPGQEPVALTPRRQVSAAAPEDGGVPKPGLAGQTPGGGGDLNRHALQIGDILTDLRQLRGQLDREREERLAGEAQLRKALLMQQDFSHQEMLGLRAALDGAPAGAGLPDKGLERLSRLEAELADGRQLAEGLRADMRGFCDEVTARMAELVAPPAPPGAPRAAAELAGASATSLGGSAATTAASSTGAGERPQPQKPREDLRAELRSELIQELDSLLQAERGLFRAQVATMGLDLRASIGTVETRVEQVLEQILVRGGAASPQGPARLSVGPQRAPRPSVGAGATPKPGFEPDPRRRRGSCESRRSVVSFGSPAEEPSALGAQGFPLGAPPPRRAGPVEEEVVLMSPERAAPEQATATSPGAVHCRVGDREPEARFQFAEE